MDLKKTILKKLFRHRIIGGKHTPEERMIRYKTKWLQKEEIAEFDEAYRYAINEQLILRIKKRTGKGSDWHISLNPRKLKEIYDLIGDDGNEWRIL